MYLQAHNNAVLQETAEACNISLGGVRKIVARLQELKVLERRGPKKNSTWIVK
ncbi:MAG: hypothetical protein IKS18_00485 [Lachnospiraceae bacterium]|nr:hypothetical protein [Lachnospiraceae bacterium]